MIIGAKRNFCFISQTSHLESELVHLYVDKYLIMYHISRPLLALGIGQLADKAHQLGCPQIVLDRVEMH